MVGTVLVPLTALAAVSPAAFELQRSKYVRREAVLDARITERGLLFNDTVHCAPLHPPPASPEGLSESSAQAFG
jgi:hypothetical protein